MPTARVARPNPRDLAEELRARIKSGRLAPGTQLKFLALTQELGCSVAGAREALATLVAEGLVETERNRGFRVVPVTVETLLDLTEVRLDLETLALRRAIERGPAEWEIEILSAQHRLEATPIRSGTSNVISDLWYEVHEALHQALLSGCGSPRLMAITENLRASTEMYWRSLDPLDRGSTEELAAEHRAIVLPALARDADAAVAALRANIQATADPMIEAIRRRQGNGDTPADPAS